MIAMATRILSDYAKLLGSIEPGCCALPLSFLPHSKNAIRQATLKVLKRLEPEDAALRDALIRGYIFLAQFVDDDEAMAVMMGQAQLDSTALDAGEEPDSPEALAALRVINRIKLEMETSLAEACDVARVPNPGVVQALNA
jgi:hypothetical protein